MKQETKDLILKESFKLFAWKRYEQVTVSDLEKVTKLTRGAIFYYMKNKEHLFKEVLDKYVFTHDIIEDYDKSSLAGFINSYVAYLKDAKKQMASLGVKNVDFAYVNIENQAIYYYPDYTQRAKEKNAKMIEIWSEVIENGIKSGEISNTIDVQSVATIFNSVYVGLCYHGIILPDGINIEQIQAIFTSIYDLIKK